jgi:hypothetical protein
MGISEKINAWQQAGTICLWRYLPERRSNQGWHFTANTDAYSSLLILFSMFKSAEYPAKRALTLTRPNPKMTNMPLRDEGFKVVSPTKLRFVFDPSEPKDSWTSIEEGQCLELRLGLKWIERFEEEFRNLQGGDGDFAIGAGRNTHGTGHNRRVSFWWFVPE